MQPNKHKDKLTAQRAVWTVCVNCAHWRGSTLMLQPPNGIMALHKFRIIIIIIIIIIKQVR